MSGLWTVREVDQAQASATGPLFSAGVELTVEMGERGVDVRFASPRQRRTDLEQAAAASLEGTAARLPAALRGRLAVEAGEVRSRLRCDGAEAPLFSRAYTLASCRGVVLGIREGAAAGPFDSPWAGTLAAGEIDSALPVLLGPSAVLALISFALEATGGHVASRRDAEIPGVTVIDTASSPYPPQHHPFAGDGTASADRSLIAAGRWRNREEDAGDAVDPLFFLLTRPERALSPLAASSQFNRRNLAIGCDRRLPAPTPAIVVDSWCARTAPRGGAVPFHAELSYTGPDGRWLAAIGLLALHFDPWELLARVRGAAAPAAPGIDEDPIEGNAYGCAPLLITDLRLADLAAPGKAA